jgi:hypothetical protein
MISITAVISSANKATGIFGGFRRLALRFVLGMSAYAYQEGVPLVQANAPRGTSAVLVSATFPGNFLPQHVDWTLLIEAA